MRVVQLLSFYRRGDAVSSDAVALNRVLKDMGFESEIYADSIETAISESTQVLSMEKLEKFSGEDVAIFHKTDGPVISVNPEKLNCRKMMIFHNLVQPRFLRKDNPDAAKEAELAMRNLCEMSHSMDYCMADSQFHADILKDLGYTCPIEVRPILIPFSEYSRTPNPHIIDRFDGKGYTNLLFVGKISPQKKQEDIIRAFYCYKRYFNPKSRLFLVGSYKGMEAYYHRLCKYVQALELEDVYFTGQIPFSSVLAYYKIADIFVSMSVHTGTGISMIEAMYHNIPIVARNEAGASEIMGDSGFLLPTDDPMEAAFVIQRIISEPAMQRRLTAGQCRRQQDFAYMAVRKRFEELMQNFLNTVPPKGKKLGKKLVAESSEGEKS